MREIIQKTYEERQVQYRKEAAEAKSRYTSLSWARVILFIVSTIGIVILLDEKNGEGAGILFLILVVAFLLSGYFLKPKT